MPPSIVNCWPSPSNDGTCEVSIEYELENENVTLYDVVISIPLPCVSGHTYTSYYFNTLDCHLYSDGSYPTVTSHSGEWSLDPASHSLAWSIPAVTAHDDSKSGSLIFNVGGVDVTAFFPVDVSFIGQGSLAGVAVASVSRVDGAQGPEYSVDALVTADEYRVV